MFCGVFWTAVTSDPTCWASELHVEEEVHVFAAQVSWVTWPAASVQHVDVHMKNFVAFSFTVAFLYCVFFVEPEKNHFSRIKHWLVRRIHEQVYTFNF